VFVCCLLVFKLFLVSSSYSASKPQTVNKYLYIMYLYMYRWIYCVSCLLLLNIFAHIKLFGFQAARVSINIVSVSVPMGSAVWLGR